MALVNAIMGTIVFVIVAVAVGFPILHNSTGELTLSSVNNSAPVTGTDATLIRNIPTIFLLGVFVTVATSMI